MSGSVVVDNVTMRFVWRMCGRIVSCANYKIGWELSQNSGSQLAPEPILQNPYKTFIKEDKRPRWSVSLRFFHPLNLWSSIDDSSSLHVFHAASQTVLSRRRHRTSDIGSFESGTNPGQGRRDISCRCQDLAKEAESLLYIS